ncbi:MAG: hypothetical protein JXA93_02440, partial [Anaerolineae bacterium]|nr:hypothetical protein [Anaerolineae bacterium]
MTRHHFVTRLALVAAVLGLMAVTVPSASLVADSLPGTLALPAATDPQMDHLLFLDVTPHGERPPRQVRREAMDAFDRLFPLLAQLQEQGQIVDFWPLPEAGAVMVQGPETDALVQIRTWAGVADVVPATAEAMRGVQNSVGALQHAQVPADRLDLQPEPSAERPMALTGVGDLYGFTIYLNENRVTGTVYTGTTSIDLTLRTSSGVVKSQTTTAPTSSGYFYGYFDELVLGGDQVVVELPGQAPVTIQAAPLAVASNKATDNVWGSGVPSSELYACAYGYGRYNLCEWVLTDAGGSFSVDFGLLSIDLFMGDETYLWYYDADGFATTLQDQYVQGVYVSPASHYVSGYASPGASVSVTLKDSAGGVKATNSATASGYGSFYTYFSSTPGMAIGDRVEVQYGSEPIVSVDVVLATLAGVDPGTDTVHGTAPPNGKVEVWVYDDYLSEEAELTVTSDGAGQYVANYAGVLDFTPGSYTSAVYHDSLDNEVYAGALYAGPWAKVLLNDSSDMEGAAGPGERVEAMLRNAVGAIKSTAAAVAGSTGYFYLYFYDSAGNSIVVVPGDVVNVSFESGTNYTINTVGIDYLIDRNARTVTGVGPANSTVRLIYDYDTAVNVTTDANGAFSHTFSYMAGGQYFQAILRDVHQNDVERWGYTPQFTVYPDDDYLYGYGVFNQPVVVEVLSSGGTSKGTAYTTAGPYGYYWLSLHDIDPVVGDTVVVDTWPFHYTQVIVPLSIAADPENDLVYGTVPPGAWLNVYAS